MKTVVFHRDATAELRAAIAYYEEQRSGLGTELFDAIERATHLIAQMPQAFSPHGNDGLRKFVIRRFPYTIFYLDLDATVWIAAVAHHRRHPQYWAGRKPTT